MPILERHPSDRGGLLARQIVSRPIVELHCQESKENKNEKFRFVSHDMDALKKIQNAYGGAIRPNTTKRKTGLFELISEANVIQAVIMTDRCMDETYQRWTASGQTHSCDGQTCEFTKRIEAQGNKQAYASEPTIVSCMCKDLPERACQLGSSIVFMLSALPVPLFALCVMYSVSKVFNGEMNKLIEDAKTAGFGSERIPIRLHVVKETFRTPGKGTKVCSVVHPYFDTDPPRFGMSLTEHVREAMLTPGSSAPAKFLSQGMNAGLLSAGHIPAGTDEDTGAYSSDADDLDDPFAGEKQDGSSDVIEGQCKDAEDSFQVPFEQQDFVPAENLVRFPRREWVTCPECNEQAMSVFFGNGKQRAFNFSGKRHSQECNPNRPIPSGWDSPDAEMLIAGSKA